MKDVLLIITSIFASFYDNIPMNRKLKDVISLAISEGVKKLTLEIRSLLNYASKEETPIDKALAAKEQAKALKQKLPAFMTNVLCEGGKKRNNIVGFLPFIGFDVDYITPERVAELMKQFNENPHVFIAEPSVSGKGVHFMMHMDASDWLTEKWDGKDLKPYYYVYNVVKSYVERTFCVDVDDNCKNPEHVFGICYDETIHYKENPQPLHIDINKYVNNVVVKPPYQPMEYVPSNSYSASISDVADFIIRKIEQGGMSFSEGHRNAFVLRFAYWCNKFGVSMNETEDYCFANFSEPGFSEKEIRATVMSAYNKVNEFGTFCAPCANAQLSVKSNKKDNLLKINSTPTDAQSCAVAQTAQKPEGGNEVIEFHQTFSDKIPENAWPDYFKPVLTSMEDAESKDKMLLATLVINSGMIPKFYGAYGGKVVYSPLYILFYGPSASRKGEIGSCINIVKPLKNEIVGAYHKELEDYQEAHSLWESKGAKLSDKALRGPEPQEPEYRSPIIPANSSASAAYNALHNNNDWGIMFETEAATLTRSLLSDYGDYSDGLLAAFHHETIKMNRTKDKIRFDIEEPHLAIGLTCTPGQLPKLFPTFEEGLGNRFFFYGLNRKLEWINPFKKIEKPLDEVYEDLGKQSLEMYHQMEDLGDRKVQFMLSESQQNRFNVFFDSMLKEQFSILGDGISSFIFRLGLSAFRIAMVLTILRRYSNWDKEKTFFEGREQAIVCLDKDIDISLTIMDTLVNHTAAIYAALAKDDEGLCNAEMAKLSPPERTIFNALGDEFTTADVKTTAEKNHMSPDTVRRYVSKYVNIVHIAERVCNGRYRKVGKNGETKS